MKNFQDQNPPKRIIPLWDNVNIKHPVRNFPETGVTSNEIGHRWWPPPNVLKKHDSSKLPEYEYDFRIRDESIRSQTTEDFRCRAPETDQFSKHSNVGDNQYIYPTSKKLEKGLSLTAVHGTSEMRDAYKSPVSSSRLATGKQQYEHPISLPNYFYPPLEDQSLEKRLETFDTTYDGYEKYLDIYLTSSRLHHRPFTADQLRKPSNTNDVVTYYTFSDTPWVRRKKPSEGDWWLPIKWPKPVIDREKFKQPRREIIKHNKLKPVPGAYRTETRDNYSEPNPKPFFIERQRNLKSA